MGWPKGKPRKPSSDSQIANRPESTDWAQQNQTIALPADALAKMQALLSPTAPDNPETPMKPISFAGIHLLDEVDRLGDAPPGAMKAILSVTSYFRADRGYRIELDPSQGLVTIRHNNGQSIVVPRERVKRFEPLSA